jgi:hypothetical protein
VTGQVSPHLKIMQIKKILQHVHAKQFFISLCTQSQEWNGFGKKQKMEIPAWPNHVFETECKVTGNLRKEAMQVGEKNLLFIGSNDLKALLQAARKVCNKRYR